MIGVICIFCPIEKEIMGTGAQFWALITDIGRLFEEGVLSLTNIDRNANIADGDAIVTSNISTKFLPGILIGYASDITIDSQHLTMSGKLIPVADFDGLQEVLVITQTKSELGITDHSEEAAEVIY